MPRRTRGITEKAFMAQVVQLARHLGYRVYHTHDSRHSAKGFPDLVLARLNPPPPRLIFAELKVPPNTATPEQEEWLAILRAAGQEAYLWMPEDWSEIEEALGVRRA